MPDHPDHKERRREVRLRVPVGARLVRFLMHPAGKCLAGVAVVAAVAGLGVFTYYYDHYSKLIDRKLRIGMFPNHARLFAAPRRIAVGDHGSPEEIAAELRAAGYSESGGNAMGSFRLGMNWIEILPGSGSYFQPEEGLIEFEGGRIARISSTRDRVARGEYLLEPRLITNLFDRSREKRRMLKLADFPQVLKDAILSAEDKRFFEHHGLDPFGMVRAVYVDLRSGRKEQGASTLTQQLARSFFLDQRKTWRRKLPEMMITLALEQKLTKDEIFEDYCNQMYLGRRGSFSIHGFGEAAQAYFGKDIRRVSLAEAAMLAGILPNANYYNPFRAPQRVKERRDRVLALMRQNGKISEAEYAQAVATPLHLQPGASQALEAPYFVDMVTDTLQSQFQDVDFLSHPYRVYTTLDLDLQRAAVEAIRTGMEEVDKQLRRQRRFRDTSFPPAQCALIALNPHTGEIKALAGGRNYGMSQLNHVLARRQPGSIFKPFVYAAALNTAIEGGPQVFTPASTVVDEPTTFWFNAQPYEPSNFEHKFYGTVTLRQALAKSLNVATVKVGEMVGFDRVAKLAKRAGLNYEIQPTPAIALGAYDVTPFEMAGAYTVYANEGLYVKPTFLSEVRADDGRPVYTSKRESHPVLDKRVAYLMTDLMQEVLRSGTGAGVRARGFRVPAAGKTGTSRDGWFAGYTSELLCIVWVGFDDNRELDLEGAHSAAPIWTEFMKRALEFRDYRDAKPFSAPDGIVSIDVDEASGLPAVATCPAPRAEAYIAGTQPVGVCPLHGQPGLTSVRGWADPPVKTAVAK